jgi:hypothetical protein
MSDDTVNPYQYAADAMKRLAAVFEALLKDCEAQVLAKAGPGARNYRLDAFDQDGLAYGRTYVARVTVPGRGVVSGFGGGKLDAVAALEDELRNG